LLLESTTAAATNSSSAEESLRRIKEKAIEKNHKGRKQKFTIEAN
jgi:hypothetical protein